MRRGRCLDAGRGGANPSQSPLLLRPISAVHRERAPLSQSRTAPRGGPRVSPRTGPHARALAQPRARLTADTVGLYSAPPNSEIGDGGVAFTDNQGRRRCQSDRPWRIFFSAWKMTHRLPRQQSASHVLWAVSSSTKPGRECQTIQAAVDNIALVERVNCDGGCAARCMTSTRQRRRVPPIHDAPYPPALLVTTYYFAGAGRPARDCQNRHLDARNDVERRVRGDVHGRRGLHQRPNTHFSHRRCPAA